MTSESHRPDGRSKVSIGVKIVIKSRSYMFRKNKKTTIAGILATIGLGLQNTPNQKLSTVGTILSGIAFLLLGSSAQDAPKE